MRLIPVLILVLTASLGAESAHAGWRIDRATAIAGVVWGPAPCGDVSLRWGPLPPEVDAVAHIEACAVEFNTTRSARTWPEFCTTMIHEWGHLAGYRHPEGLRRADGTVDHLHSPNARSVMHSGGLVTIGRFRRRGRLVVRYTGVDARCANRGRSYLGLPGRVPFREAFR